MTQGPYSTAAAAYWQAGWRGILPLPHKKKANPPEGYTGGSGVDPSFPDIHTWATDPSPKYGGGNIALRLPRNVIGIDVDNYGDKEGALTVASSEKEWGTLPPTWRTTSRDDGVSGIRLYQVPEGLAWPGELGPSTEIIQHGHRYAVVCPSVHPEGKTYRWVNPAGVTSTSIPDPDELPMLPDAWVEGLTKGELAQEVLRGSLKNAEAIGWLVTLPGATGVPCHRMTKAVDQMTSALPGSAHNAARDGALRAVRLATEGHAGLITAIGQMKRMFLADATSHNRALLTKRQRTPAEAEYEWGELLTSAANLVTANPSDAQTCDCNGQITAAVVGGGGLAVSGANALAPQVEPAHAPPVTEQERNPQEAPARLKDGATFILDAPEGVPTVWGDGDEVLWAQGECLMLVGPPGVGKTTLTGQIVRSRLGLGGAVLGLTVAPTTSRILYLAMDRPQQIARALRRTFGPADRDALADKLRVWEGPPPGDVAKNTGIFVALADLAGADTIIVDSLKDAAIGLTDDETAAGYNRARQTALAAGIQVLELHHLVKRGPNGAKPNTLADVYGSAWLTAGAGSVLLLWGAAGDLVIEVGHLKQPAAEFGPVKVIHDHIAGVTSIFHATDLVQLVAASGRAGLTAPAAARTLFDKDKPSDGEIEKARRRLKKLVETGDLVCLEPGEGRPVAVFCTPVWEPTQAHVYAQRKPTPPHESHLSVSPTQSPRGPRGTSIHAQNEPTQDPTHPTRPGAAQAHETTPLFRGGGGSVRACRTCGEVAQDDNDLDAAGECHDCRWTK